MKAATQQNEQTKGKRVIIYARVSTDEQKTSGYGLDIQLDRCRAFTKQMGWTIIKEFQEDYTGRAAFGERPEGKKLVGMFARREADIILFDRPDRIARRLVFGLTAVSHWLGMGVRVFTVRSGEIKDESDLTSLIEFWKGDADWSTIVGNLKDGRIKKMTQKGRVLGGRAAPYGFQFEYDEKGKTSGLVIYEPEARIVRLIYQWYVKGDENGRKLASVNIARKLTEMRIPTPGVSRKAYKRKRADHVWASCQVHEILRRETYAGVWWYGARPRIGTSRTLRPREEQIAVKLPESVVILDRATWEQAQEQRKRNQEFSPRNLRHNYLLRGLIKCGECGYSMCGSMTHGYRYYGCSFKNNHHDGLEPSCTARKIRAEIAETEAWGDIKNVMRNVAEFKELLHGAQKQEEEQQEPLRAELQAVEKLIEKTDREADEIALGMLQAKGRVKESLQRRQDEINARYDELVIQRDELLTKLSERQFTDEAIRSMEQYAADVRAGLDNATFEDKRRMLEELKAKVTVTKGQVKVVIAASPP